MPHLPDKAYASDAVALGSDRARASSFDCCEGLRTLCASECSHHYGNPPRQDPSPLPLPSIWDKIMDTSSHNLLSPSWSPVYFSPSPVTCPV